jgi:iron complex transport system substrate-binding protein
MKEFRIVSFLPSATEMVAALGMEEFLVGVSHECDWPPTVKKLPVVVNAALDTNAMSPKAVDEAVADHARRAQSLYVVDEDMLALLRPTHIITQDLCHVCAPSGNELARALQALPNKPEIIVMSPQTLTGIAQNLRELGAAFGPKAEAEAETLLIEWKSRMDDVQERVRNRPRVRCFVMEWVDPLYCSGHWIAEMAQMAGGYDLLARPGQDSVRVTWEEVCAAAPEVLIIAPCGYDLDQASDQLPYLQTLPGWEELPAVQQKRVYAVNANAFLTRPGPRVVDGIEMLAYLFHGAS